MDRSLARRSGRKIRVECQSQVQVTGMGVELVRGRARKKSRGPGGWVPVFCTECSSRSAVLEMQKKKKS